MLKLPHNCTHLTQLQSNAQNSPNQDSTYVNQEIPDVQAGFRRGRGIEIKLPTPVVSSKKQESSRKTSTSALLTMPKPLTVWITTVQNSDRDGNIRPPDLPLEKPVYRSGSNS